MLHATNDGAKPHHLTIIITAIVITTLNSHRLSHHSPLSLSSLSYLLPLDVLRPSVCPLAASHFTHPLLSNWFPLVPSTLANSSIWFHSLALIEQHEWIEAATPPACAPSTAWPFELEPLT